MLARRTTTVFGFPVDAQEAGFFSALLVVDESSNRRTGRIMAEAQLAVTPSPARDAGPDEDGRDEEQGPLELPRAAEPPVSAAVANPLYAAALEP